MFYMTYRIIHRSISALRIEDVTTVPSVQSEPLSSRVDRVLKIYKALSPFLLALSSVPLIPPTWRAALIAFIQALDLLAAGMPAATPTETPSPATVSIADPTTTDPTSTDPSFKAGKDL
jgi:hypothetical protein